MILALALLCPQDVLERLEKNVESLRDLECEYALDVPFEDPDAAEFDYRARLSLVRGKALSIEARRRGASPEEGALPPFRFRCLYAPDSILYEVSTLEPRARGSGVPVARMRFRADPGHPSFRRIDPFLSPAEFPARLYFDDPLLLATVAPRQFLALEPNLEARREGAGWVLEARRSFVELARAKGLRRVRILAVARRYFVDGQGRLERCEMRFRMRSQGDADPLVSYRVRRRQTVGGSEIPAEIEVGYGEIDGEDRARIERRRIRRVTVIRSNANLEIAPDPDLAAPAVLRPAAHYERLLARRPDDPYLRYARVLARHVGGMVLSGLGEGDGRGHFNPGDAYEDLKIASPQSTAARSCALFLAAEVGDLEAWKSEIPDERAWLRALGREIEVDPAKLSDEGRDLYELARDAAPAGPFERRRDLAALYQRWSKPIPKEEPLGRLYGGDASALEEIAKDPAAAAFVLVHARDRIDYGPEEIPAALQESLERAIEAAAKHRDGDPLVPAVRGMLAWKTGGDAPPHFAVARRLARAVAADSPYLASAVAALAAAARYSAGDESALVAAAEAQFDLAARTGTGTFEAAERLAGQWAGSDRLADLYRLLRRHSWRDDRSFAGIYKALHDAGRIPAFAEAAARDCRERKEAAEHLALARLVRDRLRLASPARELAAEARRLAPSDPEAVRLFAEMAAPDEAVAAWKAIGGALAKVAIAEIELARSRPDAARASLRDLATDDASLAERAAAAWAGIGDVEEALRAYDEAARRGRRRDLAIGRLLARKGDFAGAIRRYNRSFDSGEFEGMARLSDPLVETAAERAKAELYQKAGGDFLLDPFLARTFRPLPKEKEDRVRAILADPDEDGWDEIRAIGPDAAPLLRPKREDRAVRKVLLEWAEPR